MKLSELAFADNEEQRLRLAALEQRAANLLESHGDQEAIDATQDQRIAMLEQELAESKMYLAAVIRLLVQQETLQIDALVGAAQQIDKADGKADGGYTGPISSATE